MKNYDLIIFGATSFVGKFAVARLSEIIKTEGLSLKWAISGRSITKLNNVVRELKIEGYDVTNVPIIICDVEDDISVIKMTKQTKILLNSVGPYTEYGESVVKACIQTGTHLLDITAEINYVDEISKKYHDEAEKAKVLVISGCGFGCVPSDLGILYLQQYYKGELKLIRSYNEFIFPYEIIIPFKNCLIHGGTWKSFLHVLEDHYTCRERYRQKLTSEDDNGPLIRKVNGKLFCQYPGPENFFNEKSQLYLAEKKGLNPVPCRSYLTFPGFTLLFLVPLFYLLYYLTQVKFIRRVLVNYMKIVTLGFASDEGPTTETRRKLKFVFNIVGEGKSEERNNIKVRVSGVDPGYEATMAIFLSCGLTLLKEHSIMPRGGVLTPASAFYGTSIINTLKKNGINYELVEN